MRQLVDSEDPLGRISAVLSEQGWRLFGAALVLSTLGVAVLPQPFATVAVAIGAVLAALVGAGQLVLQLQARRGSSAVRGVAAYATQDPAPVLLTSPDGEVRFSNPAAVRRFRPAEGGTLARALGDVFANPSGVLYRLQERAAAMGSAREDVVTRRGNVRLSVMDIGVEGFLWRFDEMAEARSPARGAESLSLPMLVAAKSGAILFMNEAMRGVLGGRAKALDRVVRDLPLRPGGVHEVNAATGTIRCRIAEVLGPGERRELFFLPAEGAPAARRPEEDASFEELPVALLQLSADGRIERTNRLSREILRVEDAEAADGLLGESLLERLEGLGRPVRDWLAEAAQGRGLGKPEVLRMRAPDAEVFLQITLGRIARHGDIHLVAVLNDATELKTLEAQFVQSQKMQAIGQLAGGVAHDFNNLLTAISGHCDLLLLRHDQGDPDYGDLVQIHQNANRAAALVGQLLAFSRKQTLQPQVLDLRDALSDLTHLLSRLVGERITLTLHHDPGLPAIRADRRQLEQVLMNLVVNARDAMPEGGEIRIETQAVTLADELRRDRATVPAGQYVVVKVEDQGIGIPPDKLTKIFEPFYTTKRTGEGTGLGLSTAYGIVKQTGGYIFVDSVVGVGSAFTLYFPAFTGAAALQSEAALPSPVPDQPRRTLKAGEGVVLLVEDEAPVRAFASRALRMRGYTVLEAENAEDALKTLADATLKVDLFVTDVIMPGMDGPSWVRKAREARPDVKVVFVSGYAEDTFGDEQARIPNSVFLPKPFSLTELTATVQDQIH